MRLISTHRFPALGNKESCLGPGFQLFTISDQCTFQKRLCQMDISTFSLKDKAAKTCPKYEGHLESF